MTWERLLCILHLPWLALPALAGVLFVFALIERLVGADGAFYMVAVVMVGLVWFFGSLFCLAAWWSERGKAYGAAGVQPAAWSNRLSFVAGLTALLGAGVLGFWGGGAAALAIGFRTGALYWD